MPRKPKPPPPKEHRRHGEGTAYQEKSGVWRAAITVRLKDGSTKRIYRRAPTEEAVWLAIDAVRKAVAADLDPAAGDETVRAFLLRWLENTAKPSISRSTYEVYERHTRKIIAHIGGVKLNALTASHVQTLYATLLREGLGAGTIRITQAVMHRSLKQARRWGLIALNVAEDVDLPPKPDPDVHPFTPAETVRLLDYADDNPTNLSACWTVLATTGLRIGEALGLRWDDIDLEVPRLNVQYQLNRYGELVPLKTKRSRRLVKLLPRTVAALRAHRARQTEAQLANGWPSSPLVFRNIRGEPWSHRIVSHHWEEMLKRATLPHHKIHALRHGVTSYLLSQGVNARSVADILGHASPAMTLDVYGHTLPGGQDEAMDRLNALLKRADSG